VIRWLRLSATDAPRALCLVGLHGQLKFCEGEPECTSEMAAGQFSIFGAVEEKGRNQSTWIFTDYGPGKCIARQRDGESFEMRPASQ
jgi:hypothetical protein